MTITNNTSASRFEAIIEGKTAVVDYMDRGKMIVFTHTEVPQDLEGQGIAGKIARSALDFAREKGKIVLPLCPYIAAYIRRHPEYAPLVLPGYRY